MAAILIVDDSSTQRLVLTAILKKAGYTELAYAASGNEVFEQLSQPPAVDLILLDVEMPDWDGLTVCRRIKATEAWQAVPVIMVTGSASEDTLAAAFAAGAMDYIVKPPSQTVLLARVRSALRLKAEMDRRKAREAELNVALTALDEKKHQIENSLLSLAEKHCELMEARDRSERLLLNILPAPVAARLKADQQAVIADHFAEATVLFADIVDFTSLAACLSPQDLVSRLNQIFSFFDQLAEKHGLEKIKTIGDAYMVVGGLPTPRSDHVEAVADMALDMRAGLAAAVPDAPPVRIGIHTGPVIAGVIGIRKFSYDLWGDTVNVASRMEAHGLGGQIHISAATWARLSNRYRVVPRGLVLIKSMGEVETYFLVGRRP